MVGVFLLLYDLLCGCFSIAVDELEDIHSWSESLHADGTLFANCSGADAGTQHIVEFKGKGSAVVQVEQGGYGIWVGGG